MKFRSLKVPKFIYRDYFGEIESLDVKILFNPEVNEITLDSFNQNSDEYFLEDSEIQRLSHESAMRFYNTQAKEIFGGRRPLEASEVKGIKEFFGVNGSDLGKLIGVDKASISRMLRGTQVVHPSKANLLVILLNEEINFSGYSRTILSHLSQDDSKNSFDNLKVDVLEVSEYFIRKFKEIENPITHLKLQKLLYYAQGIGLGNYDVKLFEEPILAWNHGPVVELAYYEHKKAGQGPLASNSEINIEALLENKIACQILDETISRYGDYSAWFLRNKTHNEPPWYETPRNDKITDKKMASFFRRILI